MSAAGTAFPWGTLAVNLVGCFTAGAVLRLAGGAEGLGEPARALLLTGVLGGFTTYSAFNAETLGAIDRGAAGLASGYVAATVVGGLAAGRLGALAGGALARLIFAA